MQKNILLAIIKKQNLNAQIIIENILFSIIILLIKIILAQTNINNHVHIADTFIFIVNIYIYNFSNIFRIIFKFIYKIYLDL